MPRYKINLVFHGTATVEMEAKDADAARLLAAELTPIDLARAGHADILTFKIAAREVTPTAALGGEHHSEEEVEKQQKPRPSGWYRPL